MSSYSETRMAYAWLQACELYMGPGICMFECEEPVTYVKGTIVCTANEEWQAP